MKRFLTLVMVALMLLLPAVNTMAAKAEKIPANEGESRVCESPKDYKEYAKAYCKKYGDKYTNDFAEAFFHAVDALPSDYSKVDKKLPKYLYTHPYNMSATKVDESTFKANFKTNVQLLKAIGENEIAEILNSACSYSNVGIDKDYRKDTAEDLKANVYKYLPKSAEEKNLAEDEIEFRRYYELVSEGIFITDPSLVYQCANGRYRVRGRLVFRYTSATREYQKNNSIRLNTWYYQDFETLLDEYQSNKPSEYEREKYVVGTWFAISNGYQKADKTTVKLAKKLMTDNK